MIEPNTPGSRLKVAREKAGFETAKRAALHMAVPLATYCGHEKSERHIPARRAAEYARHFNVTPEYIQYGRTAVAIERVPVVDAMGEETGQGAILPPPSTLTLAQAVESDGFAFFGLVALYDEPQTRSLPPHLDGLFVVSVQADGANAPRRFVCTLQRGATEGRFDLLKPGALAALRDRPIVWAAPVIALVPAN